MVSESILWFVKHFHIHPFIWGRLNYFSYLFTKYLLSICPMLGTVRGVLHMLPPNMTSPVCFTVFLSLWQKYHCCFAYEKTMAISGIQRWRTPCPCSLEQRWANFGYKGTNSKYFRLCDLYSLVCVCVCVHAHALSCVWLFVTSWIVRLLCPLYFPGKNTRVSCHFFLQGSFWPSDGTHVSCIGWWILYHCITWEAPHNLLQLLNSAIKEKIAFLNNCNRI